jgi:hypothetical protein
MRRSLRFWAWNGLRAVCSCKTTWNRGSLSARSILWRAPPRGAVATHAKVSAEASLGLRYVLVPRANRATGSRSKSRSPVGVRLDVGDCCDALRCSGPHARYTDEANEFYSSNGPWPEGLGNLVKLHRAGDRALQLLLFNEEFLVVVIHQIATITSLPFVHTARRYYRLNGLVRPLDRLRLAGNGGPLSRSWSNLVI